MLNISEKTIGLAPGSAPQPRRVATVVTSEGTEPGKLVRRKILIKRELF